MRYLLSVSARARVRGGIASAVVDVAVVVEATQIDLALLVGCV